MSAPAQSGQVFQPQTDLRGLEWPPVSLLPQPEARPQEGHSPVQVNKMMTRQGLPLTACRCLAAYQPPTTLLPTSSPTLTKLSAV